MSSALDRPMIAVMILALFWPCSVQLSTKLLSTLILSKGAERS
jgi:hypothetical protein